MTLEELAEKLGITLDDSSKGHIASYVAAQTTGIKANRDQLLKDNKDLKTKLKAFDGIDADDLTTVLAELDLEAGDIVERLKTPPNADGKDAAAIKAAAEAEAEKKWSGKVTKAEKRATDAEAKTTASEKARVDSEIDRQLTTELAAKKGIPDLLMPMLRGRIKGEIDADTGKINLKVLAPNGDEMQGASGAMATVADLVETIKRDDKFGGAFEAEGGGSGGGKGGDRKPVNGRVNPWMKATRNLTEQAKISAENPTLAAQLKKAAQAANAN